MAAVLILSYNLSKDFWFILVSDKGGVLTAPVNQMSSFGTHVGEIPQKVCMLLGYGCGDRFDLRISLFLVFIGSAGLYIEITNAFEYIQGARKGFKPDLPPDGAHSYLEYWILNLKKIDADCIGSTNQRSPFYFIDIKDDSDLS